MKKVWLTARRLALGLSLITFACSVLLVSDLRSRRPVQARTLADRSSSQAVPANPGAEIPLAKIWKLHLIALNDVPAIEESREGVLAGLDEAGLIRQRDYQIKLLNAQGDMPTLSALIDSALGDQTDMLIVISTVALQTALKKVRDRPLVFAQVTDPIKAGAGRTLEDHLPNVTGSTPLSDHDQMIRVIRQCLPAVKKIGTLYNPSEDNSVIQQDGLIASAKQAGIEVESLAVNQSAEIPNSAVALCSSGIDAICQISDNLTSSAFPSIVSAARKAHLPVFCYQTAQAQAGGVVAVARDFLDAGKVAGKLAAQIIRGANPAKLPFALVAQSRLVINRKEAEALGLHIPEALARQADGYIDQTGYHAISAPAPQPASKAKF